MKKYLIFAASALALASCSSDDFLGENPGTAQNATTAITSVVRQERLHVQTFHKKML